MTIYTAARQRDVLLEALRVGGAVPLEVDLSRVTEIDSAGVQLMLAARRSAAASGRTLRFTAAEPAVRSVLALLRLDWILDGASDESCNEAIASAAHEGSP
jgi:anti-sigma B factor antagonist